MVAPLERVPGVEVFATGEYPQGRYTLNDLTRIVLNSKKIGRSGLRLHSASVGMVPQADVGIGHERDDAVTKVSALMRRFSKPPSLALSRRVAGLTFKAMACV